MKIFNSILLSSFLLSFSCQSIQEYNASLQKPIQPDQLRKDIDYGYSKLKQLHPKLYWYISKEKLDYKFDSLKKSIQQPMTGKEFYFKFSEVTRVIGQGHLGISPSLNKLTKTENLALKKKGKGPFSQLEFEIFDHKLFLIKDKSRNQWSSVNEVIEINNQPASELISKFTKRLASDGYNTTFFPHFVGKQFGIFYTYENGIKDSIQLKLKLKEKDTLLVVRRDTFGTNEKKVLLSKKEKRKEELEKRKVGFDKDLKSNMRELTFLKQDSSVALLTIRGFRNGDFTSFYNETFDSLKKQNTKTLIIDLRNNPGGRLMEIDYLYSFLVDKPYKFVEDYEVVSRTSKLHVDYFKGGGIIFKTLKIIAAPFYYSINYLKVRKEEDKYLYATRFSKERQPKPNHFDGKLYVLINGGSFSASSIISSKLKGTNRAYFVGEETGGAYNGTVAAQMPLVTLPNSKVNMRVGLALVAAFEKSDVEGRGVFPDKVIIPTVEDRIKKVDPELNWIIDNIKREKEVKQLLQENFNK